MTDHLSDPIERCTFKPFCAAENLQERNFLKYPNSKMAKPHGTHLSETTFPRLSCSLLNSLGKQGIFNSGKTRGKSCDDSAISFHVETGSGVSVEDRHLHPAPLFQVMAGPPGGILRSWGYAGCSAGSGLTQSLQWDRGSEEDGSRFGGGRVTAW